MYSCSNTMSKTRPPRAMTPCEPLYRSTSTDSMIAPRTLSRYLTVSARLGHDSGTSGCQWHSPVSTSGSIPRQNRSSKYGLKDLHSRVPAEIRLHVHGGHWTAE